jgi:hypothetical protein
LKFKQKLDQTCFFRLEFFIEWWEEIESFFAGIENCVRWFASIYWSYASRIAQFYRLEQLDYPWLIVFCLRSRNRKYIRVGRRICESGKTLNRSDKENRLTRASFYKLHIASF